MLPSRQRPPTAFLKNECDCCQHIRGGMLTKNENEAQQGRKLGDAHDAKVPKRCRCWCRKAALTCTAHRLTLRYRYIEARTMRTSVHANWLRCFEDGHWRALRNWRPFCPNGRLLTFAKVSAMVSFAVRDCEKDICLWRHILGRLDGPRKISALSGSLPCLKHSAPCSAFLSRRRHSNRKQ